MNQVGNNVPLNLNQRILVLNLMDNRITGDDFSNICKSGTLKIVELYHNQISFKADGSLSLPSNNSLTKIGLGRNALSSACTSVLKELASIRSLETLNLTGNQIDDAGASILYQHRSTSLKEIDLTDNPIQDLALLKKGKKI